MQQLAWVIRQALTRLMRRSFGGRQLIKQLKPLANSVLQQSTMMYENIKQEAERRYVLLPARRTH